MIIIFSIFIALVLIGTSYIINEKNAKYYLSGYWNLSPEKREAIDLKGFLANWKRVMLISGIIITLTGVIMYFTNVDGKYAVITILIMTLLSFIAFYLSSRRYK